MRTIANKKIAAVAAGAVVLASAGAAYAYWTTSGSGTGSATTGTAVAWDVTTDAATGDPLSPDGPAQTVAFHVHNDSSGVQNLQAVNVTVAGAAGDAWTSGTCSAADYEVGAPTFTPGDVASGDTVDGTVTIQMIDTGSNQDDCKNVTVPLYVAAS